MKWGWIFAAGGLGAVLRYGLASWVQERTGVSFPWGTFTVNVLGCFAIGLLATTLEDRDVLSVELRMALMVGLLGGFTTFSTFGLDTWRLLVASEFAPALANALGSVASCILAVGLGASLARWLD